MTLRPALRALADVLADQAERDPAFAAALAAALAALAAQAPAPTAPAPAPATPAPAAPGRAGSRRRRAGPVLDPERIARESGPEALRQRLTALTVEQLKDIISHHGLDHARAGRWTRAERLIGHIVDLSAQRAAKGDVFR